MRIIEHVTGFTALVLAALTMATVTPEAAIADLNDGLVGYWSFDEGSGAVAYDGSTYGNDGTVVGASWVEKATHSLPPAGRDDSRHDILSQGKLGRVRPCGPPLHPIL